MVRTVLRATVKEAKGPLAHGTVLTLNQGKPRWGDLELVRPPTQKTCSSDSLVNRQRLGQIVFQIKCEMVSMCALGAGAVWSNSS